MSDREPGQATVGDGEMSCKELVELVTEYLEGTLSTADRRRFEEHLEECPHCVTYVEQMRQVIDALGKLDEESLSQDRMNALLAAFRDWKQDAG